MVQVLKSVDYKRAATKESTSCLIWGSEFRLIHDSNNGNETALRFISPTDGHEWTIYIQETVLIVADQNQQQGRGLPEPSLEIIHEHTPVVPMAY